MKKRVRTIAWLLIVLCIFTLTGCSSADYKQAVKLMESGDYAAASKLFDSLGDYEDSAALADACDYSIAKAALDVGEYETAQELFTALGEYEDSASLAQQASGKILEKAVLGLWVAEADITDYIKASALSALEGIEGAAEVFSYFDLNALIIKYRLEFTESGTFVIDADEGSISALFEQVADIIADGVRRYFEDLYIQLVQEAGITMEDLYSYTGCSTIDELFEQETGSTIDGFVRELFPTDEMADSLTAYSSSAGVFSAEDGRLTLTYGRESAYAEYFADTNELVLTDGDISETALIFTRP